ncbi:hypothetical protein BCR33DRAFT_724170 [Rhizoclosmatium globosum]|uniref:Uncharacterized protein n=1 Tax=Rhizoclosmatium globosum TaxID=329046 RepID=A0A1Y2B7Z6_9FUNG|nr:hypothetical protein BCR33DRAFT_724170 [Rhizoclosmatium globosum]|eukprot:ORY30951.1 hypothetical protein BCR33DRAFT_724170 [Rhizoclosmatium globosum]
MSFFFSRILPTAAVGFAAFKANEYVQANRQTSPFLLYLQRPIARDLQAIIDPRTSYGYTLAQVTA